MILLSLLFAGQRRMWCFNSQSGSSYLPSLGQATHGCVGKPYRYGVKRVPVVVFLAAVKRVQIQIQVLGQADVYYQSSTV